MYPLQPLFVFDDTTHGSICQVPALADLSACVDIRNWAIELDGWVRRYRLQRKVVEIFYHVSGHYNKKRFVFGKLEVGKKNITKIGKWRIGNKDREV